MRAAGIENAGLEANLKRKDYCIFYDAPAVIFIYAAPGILTGVEDASLAAGNIMLAAKAMGMGTCWIGLAAGLGSDASFLMENNIPDGHKLLASIILVAIHARVRVASKKYGRGTGDTDTRRCQLRKGTPRTPTIPRNARNYAQNAPKRRQNRQVAIHARVRVASDNDVLPV